MPKLTRSDLERPRTPHYMKELLRSFAEDGESYPSQDRHLRRGLVKVLLEEYRLLCAFACHVSVRTAWLTPESNKGPDGYVELESGEKLAVQITVADQSDEEARKRKILSQSESVSNGFMREEVFLRRPRQDIADAIKNKIGEKFHPGTDVLLVGTMIPVKAAFTDSSWIEDMLEQIGGVEKIPYSRVYVVNSVVLESEKECRVIPVIE
jgi:hypothetical protein